MISGELGGFHCSSIGSIVIGDVGCGDSVHEKVMVLMVRDPEMPKSIYLVVLVNNTSRNGRVLKFVLVIQAIEEYLSILGCHLPQP